MPEMVDCTYCGGDGMHGSHRDDGPCANCAGTGKVPVGARDPDGTVARSATWREEDDVQRLDRSEAVPAEAEDERDLPSWRRDDAIADALPHLADAARAFADLCAMANDTLALWFVRNQPKREAPEPIDGRWRCPRCGGGMQSLNALGQATRYGCARGHDLAEAPPEAVAVEQVERLNWEAQQRG